MFQNSEACLPIFQSFDSMLVFPSSVFLNIKFSKFWKTKCLRNPEKNLNHESIVIVSQCNDNQVIRIQVIRKFT